MTLKSNSATKTFDIFSFLKFEFDIFSFFKIWVRHFFLSKYTVRHFFLFQILQQKCWIVIFFLIRHFFLDHKKGKNVNSTFFLFDIFSYYHKSTHKLKNLHTNSQDNIEFDVAKCAVQLLYGPVLVFISFFFLVLLTYKLTNWIN